MCVLYFKSETICSKHCLSIKKLIRFPTGDTTFICSIFQNHFAFVSTRFAIRYILRILLARPYSMAIQEQLKELNYMNDMRRACDLAAGEWQCIHLVVHVIR